MEELIQLEGVARRYDMGEVTVTALEQVDLTDRARASSSSSSAPRERQDDAAEHDRRARLADRGDDPDRAARTSPAPRAPSCSRFRRQTVSFIFQTFNLFPALTALENVEFGADVSGRRDAARASPPRRSSGSASASRGGHFPHELSGGEQQRVAIARALATGNPILLADEPTGELDFRTGVQILELLHEQTHDQDTAVLVVTHNREIARVAHRVIELSSGRIVSDGPQPGRARRDLRAALVSDATCSTLAALVAARSARPLGAGPGDRPGAGDRHRRLRRRSGSMEDWRIAVQRRQLRGAATPTTSRSR